MRQSNKANPAVAALNLEDKPKLSGSPRLLRQQFVG